MTGGHFQILLSCFFPYRFKKKIHDVKKSVLTYFFKVCQLILQITTFIPRKSLYNTRLGSGKLGKIVENFLFVWAVI
jgi:hypothetical protein